ncbi:MAG: hypothetical protein ACOCRU_02275 [bacterium]
MYEEYDRDTARILIEYARACQTPEDDGYMAFWCSIIFNLSADSAVRLVAGIRKNL